MVLEALFRAQAKLQSSDLHLTAGMLPRMRGPEGGLYEVQEYEPTSEAQLTELLKEIMKEGEWDLFIEDREYDGSFTMPEVGRFRVNAFFESEGLGMVCRYISDSVKTFEELGLPNSLYRFTEATSGLFLITGQGNSGKSTTLTSLIEVMNTHFPYHIITVEDPIEYRFTSKKSLIHQRNVGTDTHSYQDALKYAMRQNPDVVVVGEMRDRESIEAALTLAETGHLVIGTLHTQKAASTIERIINTFPGGQQQQVRLQLSLILQGILCQQLIPKKDGSGRALAYEYMVVTPPIRNHIKEGSFAMMYDAIQSSKTEGMKTFEQSLVELYNRGLISKDEVLFRVEYPEDVMDKLL